jgi:hypothetical protein
MFEAVETDGVTQWQETKFSAIKEENKPEAGCILNYTIKDEACAELLRALVNNEI